MKYNLYKQFFSDYNSTKIVRAKIIKKGKYEEASTSNSDNEIPDYKNDLSNTTEVDKWNNSTDKLKDDNHLCKCRAYRCRCCINFSFIRRWPAVGKITRLITLSSTSCYY